MAARPSAAVRMLHVGVLYALAVSQPLFGVLGDNAEFFTSRQATAGDVVVFTLLVALAPPLVAGAVEALVDRVSRAAGWMLHLLLVWLLLALIAIQAVKKAADLGPVPMIAVAGVLAAIVAALYARSAPLRLVTTWLSPLPLLVLVLFVFGTPVHKLIFRTSVAAAKVTAAPTPIVMLVFDEFTGTTLLDRHNRIDRHLFPNFARLVADGGVYYRNYTAAADETTRVIAGLMTGDRWKEHALPIAPDYPRNLFTLLGGVDRLVVGEEASDFCPQNLCRTNAAPETRSAGQGTLLQDAGLVYLHRVSPPRLEERLTPVDETLGRFGDADTRPPGQVHGKQQVLEALGGGGRPMRFAEWLRRIDGGGRTLYFKHVLLPHVPWQYLPDGRVYRRHPEEYIPGLNGRKSFHDRWLLVQAYQRHILQTQFSDLLLGQLLERLKQTGLYDRALIVVTADNGESFLRLGHDRHIADSATFTDIASTPLLIKRPGKQRGGYDDRHVRTFDVVPTIADVVGTKVPWQIEGRSIFARDGGIPERVEVTREQFGHGSTFSASLAEYERARQLALDRKIALFGSNGKGPGLWGAGPARELIGKPLARLPVAPAAGVRGNVTGEVAGLLRDVDLSSDFVPVNVTGEVSGRGIRRGLPVALALNGRIAAVGWTAMLDDDRTVYFTFFAPPRAFRNGSNHAEVFLVNGGRGARRLERIAVANP